MFVSGFTFIRNGVQLDFPFEESIRSLSPLVDELVVNVGVSDDTTLERVKSLAAADPKIRWFPSEWDENLRKGGAILAQQTNLAMAACKGKWGIYIQGDEVFHEEDTSLIRAALERASQNEAVDGFLFDYVHFYGDYFVVNRNPSAYRREVRAVRLDRSVTSWKDAQGFRKKVGNDFLKLQVIHSGARVFHYGWVRPPEKMEEKTRAFDKLFHGDQGGTGENYRYKRIYGLERFTGTHPRVMEERVKAKRWKVDLMDTPLVFTWKDIRKVFTRWIEKSTGWLPFEYQNYKRMD